MKRNIVLPFFASSLLFSLPIVVSASGLVPCGGPSDPCTLCHLITGISGVILTIRNIMFWVGLAIITAMGVMYVLSGGDSKMMETAKGGIKSTLIGIVVILSSWLIVNAVMFYVFSANEDLGVGAEFKGVDGFRFECNTASTSGTTVASQINRATSGSVCEDPDTELARLKSGGTVCAGTGRCPSCDTSAYSKHITAASKKYGVPESLIKAFIAKETQCKNITGTTGDCGLMQVNPSNSSYSCDELKNPETGIMEGTRILKLSYDAAKRLSAKYGKTVTVMELTGAIYNAGERQSDSSADCKTSDGWPVIPKWGCPINPGTASFNACSIRSYACDIGKCGF